MIPDQLPVDAAMRATPVDRGWAQVIRRGPRTVRQVLEDASAAMDEQDRLEAYRRDPVTWLRAERRRRTLWGRMFGRH